MHSADASVGDHLEKLTMPQNLTMRIDNLYAFVNPLVLSFPIHADANAAASIVTVFQPFENKKFHHLNIPNAFDAVRSTHLTVASGNITCTNSSRSVNAKCVL